MMSKGGVKYGTPIKETVDALLSSIDRLNGTDLSSIASNKTTLRLLRASVVLQSIAQRTIVHNKSDVGDALNVCMLWTPEIVYNNEDDYHVEDIVLKVPKKPVTKSAMNLMRPVEALNGKRKAPSTPNQQQEKYALSKEIKHNNIKIENQREAFRTYEKCIESCKNKLAKVEYDNEDSQEFEVIEAHNTVLLDKKRKCTTQLKKCNTRILNLESRNNLLRQELIKLSPKKPRLVNIDGAELFAVQSPVNSTPFTQPH